MTSTPGTTSDKLRGLLCDGRIEEFNRMRPKGATLDLRGLDLRHNDLRDLDTAGLDLGDCHLRQADLRGLDLRETNLEGASIASAKISGAYFPRELSAEEINLSLQHGTRMRYR
jgi:uncharacterized protein YjbI with pentapeptide repeats